MRLQCNSGPALPTSQDAPCNSTRETQQDGYHVCTCEIVCCFLQRSHFDCRGNVLVTGSTTSVVIGLTWGGVRYPWSSAHVLSPLIIGLLGLCVFVIYEIYFCKPPIVSPFAGPRKTFSTDTFQGPRRVAHELDGREWLHPEFLNGRGIGNLKLYVKSSQCVLCWLTAI